MLFLHGAAISRPSAWSSYPPWVDDAASLSPRVAVTGRSLERRRAGARKHDQLAGWIGSPVVQSYHFPLSCLDAGHRVVRLFGCFGRPSSKNGETRRYSVAPIGKLQISAEIVPIIAAGTRNQRFGTPERGPVSANPTLPRRFLAAGSRSDPGIAESRPHEDVPPSVDECGPRRYAALRLLNETGVGCRS